MIIPTLIDKFMSKLYNAIEKFLLLLS